MPASPEPNVVPRKRHRLIDRVAAVLETAARSRDGVTLSDVAEVIGAPLSSAQDIVNGLVATGYLDEQGKRYTLGLAPYLLNVLAGRRMVSAVTHEDLEAIHTEVGLTTVLSVAVGHDAFYLDYCSADPRYAYLAESHLPRSLIRTSSGWILMAGMAERDLWSYLRELPEDEAEHVDLFLGALTEIRETGLCATPNVSAIVGDGISIAVTERGRTVASVCVIDTPQALQERRSHVLGVLTSYAARWNS
ncbi:MAG TPA: helix-turn-helix domain-containing protein [Trebonia sp.]